MKILALIGSPRRGSNTDILVDRVLQGAQSCGQAARSIYLHNYQIMLSAAPPIYLQMP